MKIHNDPKVTQWFTLIGASEKTKEQYLTYIKLYCETANKTPTQLIDTAIKEFKKGKLPTERQEFEYINKFLSIIDKKGLAPKTKASCIAIVKSFYKAYDIQLTSSFGKNQTTETLEANTNTFIKREDIIKLLTNANSLRDKAIIFCMASSGMARREILNLKFKNITYDAKIGIIKMRRQKSKVDYLTFISPEAVDSIKNYLAERDRIEKLKVKGDNDFVFVSYASGDQMNDKTFMHIFYALGRKLNYQVDGGFLKTRSHALRKFFASTLENAGIPKNKVDQMLGHAVHGTDSAYFNQEIESIKRLYLEKLPLLTFEREIVVKTMDAGRLEDVEKENSELKAQIATTQNEMQQRDIAFKTQLEDLARKIDIVSIIARKDRGEVEEYEGKMFTELLFKDRKVLKKEEQTAGLD